MRVIILGAGGHGQVVADILLLQQSRGAEFEPIAYLDDNPALHAQFFLGLPVLGCLADLKLIPHEAVILGLGHNPTRRDWFVRLRDMGELFPTAVHPSAIVSPFAALGAGSVACAGSIVNPGAVVGENVILNTACTVDHHNQIGAHGHIAPGAHLGGDVRVGEGALVGIGATIMPQRQVGAWSIVGAGAVVTRDVPSGTTVTGLPARPLKDN